MRATSSQVVPSGLSLRAAAGWDVAVRVSVTSVIEKGGRGHGPFVKYPLFMVIQQAD
jgi:hypothetical protein